MNRRVLLFYTSCVGGMTDVCHHTQLLVEMASCYLFAQACHKL
jgi:hypothetical protein